MTPAIPVLPESAWFKSSYSGAGATECVETASLPGGMAVRDSRNRDEAVLAFSAGAWGAFLSRVKDQGSEGVM
ncbi:DUF397 domain-containing protein [Streptomyces sp. TRM 70361]|uniref:DUF397 domain-containing protein n=1 Tax=Streptomyces sp. TRM 70361 TaxID=3116553 RepID=UPI002E7BD45A|nr:DUF397 domain-containing protein [Streptomyces sp. TRM 70361]MEE1941650.1 DUF397 domain-containing protein [Streptomyces sp. TRM 70361]